MSYTIGILGGGQLAKMSSLEAYKLGFSVSILERIKGSPAGKITQNEFVGWVDNKKILKQFIDHSDVITLENEFIDYQYLEWIENQNKIVIPSSKTISLIQDKLTQKQTLRKANLPVPEFVEINKTTSFKELFNEFGKKFLLKSRKLGYDGYGNSLVTSEKDY